jgi:poly(3-hydroxybutyrate) depolymerase
MKKLLILISALNIALTSLGQQTLQSVTAPNGRLIPFYRFLPPSYTPGGTKHPLIIFLHGIGERGDGTLTYANRVLANAIPKYCSQGATMTFGVNPSRAFVVLSPQLATADGHWQDFYIDEMINYAKTTLNIDTNRIYLTGLSWGGGGVTGYPSTSLSNAQKLAAIAPVCGAIRDWGLSRQNIADGNLPSWFFHAADDGTVGIGQSYDVVAGINSFNPSIPPVTTYYQSGGHAIWDRAYDTLHRTETLQSGQTVVINPNMYEWFLNYSRSGVAPVNTPPNANAGTNIQIYSPVTTANLNGTASNDPNGYISSYSWVKIVGGNASIQGSNTASPSLSGLLVGVYQYELTVTDNNGATDKDTVQITLSSVGNNPPIAEAGTNNTIQTTGIILNSFGTNDPDGTISSFLWEQLSGPNTAVFDYTIYATATASNLINGTYVFRLTVTDNLGAIASDTTVISVAIPAPVTNNPPNVNAGSNQSVNIGSLNVALNGFATDSDGSIVSYDWIEITNSLPNFSASSNSTTVSITTPGVYQFQLRATDNSGNTKTDTVKINVFPSNKASESSPKQWIMYQVKNTSNSNANLTRISYESILFKDASGKTLGFITDQGEMILINDKFTLLLKSQ